MQILIFYGVFKEEFVKIVAIKNYEQITSEQKKYKENLKFLLKRNENIDIFFKKIYEDKVFSILSTECFIKLINEYESEQTKNQEQIKNFEKLILKIKSVKNNF